jgi:tRNA (guanine37-N1)-methyltransferase
MRFDIITIFPEFFSGPLDYGIVRRAREAGLIDIGVQDLRAFTHDRHRTVDDRPFGGGEGMVLKPEPLFDAVESLLGCAVPPADAQSEIAGASTADARAESGGASATGSANAASGSAANSRAANTGTDSSALARESSTAEARSAAWPPPATAVILLSASGKLFRQADARRLAGLERVVFICGRYEGVDERVTEHLATEELSIGDFVLSGGELAAALILDTVTRLIPGALGNEASAIHESFSALPSKLAAEAGSSQRGARGNRGDGGDPRAAVAGDSVRANSATPMLLDFPHYTRPAEFRGWGVPEVLMGGNHEEVRRWRERMALEKTRRNRPDLL